MATRATKATTTDIDLLQQKMLLELEKIEKGEGDYKRANTMARMGGVAIRCSVVKRAMAVSRAKRPDLPIDKFAEPHLK